MQENEAAYCATCESFLYSNDPLLLQKLFAFSLSALIFFTIANIYPIVAINISGLQGELTLLEAILRLFDEEFVFVSFFSLLVLFIFPLLLMVLLFCYAFLMLFFPLCTLSKNILIAISVVRRWSMLDIFFIAILVALIKIYEYSSIYFGPAFWSLAIFIIIEIYLVRMQPIDMLWSIWEERCEVS
ncbi:paraquat-inducible protein A [Nitratiruptor sp. YY09-18]|uniref:paraquat-inducible protein A n=1 Tax=Nitratiruptor sp. YY09-18 TaxID=2724901 RepID=UPI00191697A6|nr:paraquat-inducible protein A [Nitratiruptor sp. YY09-18]BCD67525.1 paraquat-inducible protein A [Nitratiruptor sp. YY09-18]